MIHRFVLTALAVLAVASTLTTAFQQQPLVVVQQKTVTFWSFQQHQTSALYSSSSNSDGGFDIESLKKQIPDMTSIVKSRESILDNLTSGEFGARGEVYFAAQAALIGCIAFGGVPFVGGIISFVFGPALLLVGLAVSFVAANEMGSSLSPWPVPAKSSTGLITSGLFAQVRHPIYAGLLAACVGFSVLSGDATRLLLTAGLWYVLDLKTDFEETELRGIFSDYDQYQKEVTGKFFPSILLEVLPWSK